MILSEIDGRDISGNSILDVGTGNGEIASYFGSLSRRVVSVDTSDARTTGRNFQFQIIQDEMLPFPDESFDIVISNHVIEHVKNPRGHVAEVARVLKPDGIAYLATPNRLWPWEYHYRIPLLHYLPPSLFFALLKMMGTFTEDVKLLTYPGLRTLLSDYFEISPYSDRVCREPARYEINCPIWLGKILHALPPIFYARTVTLHPTLLCVLRKK